jgi:hypothetical protein
MSRRRRSRTRSQFSQPSSMTANVAVNTVPLKLVEHRDVSEIEIRYAATDEDVCNIHKFLLIVARPLMRCPVNVVKSLNEIIRVAKYEAALMVIHNGVMVGTMGLIKPEWWYGDGEFLTERWHFVLPSFENTQAAKALMDEAKAIAALAEIEFIHQGRIRPPKNGVSLMMPRAYAGT